MKVIVPSETTKFHVTYSTTDVLDTVQPFIAAVADGLERGATLYETVMPAAEKFPQAAGYFSIDPKSLEHSFGFAEEFMFQDWELRLLRVRGGRKDIKFNLSLLGPEELRMFARGFSAAISGTTEELFLHRFSSRSVQLMFQALKQNGNLVEREVRNPAIASEGVPGIMRLQHASLLFRSMTTGILVDPHFHSLYDPRKAGVFAKSDLQGKVDAIFISHCHEDHRSLATLMMFNPDIPIIVPKVPAASIICDNMEQQLRKLGFTNVIAAEWFSKVVIGDIELLIYPFYGEQPLRYEKGKHSNVRNWGNTCVVRTPFYSAWFLIDSGNEVLGSMLDVADQVRQQAGPVDCVLSNLREFPIFGHAYINGGLNWLTLSSSQMQRFHTMKLHCITLGPENVALICKKVNARFYLPYAHWWGALGCVGDSGADTPGQEEVPLLQRLQNEITRIGCSTRIVPWTIGDGFLVAQNPKILPLLSQEAAAI